MAKYIIKAKEWKVFAWEFSFYFLIFFLLFLPKTNNYRFTVLSSNGCGVYPGFMKAPYNKYISDFNSNTEWYYDTNWGWGLYTYKTQDYITKKQLGARGETIKVGRKITDGDKFGFRVDFDKRICDILFNGKVVGSVFTEIPDEIIPVICDGSRETKISIKFLQGTPRV